MKLNLLVPLIIFFASSQVIILGAVMDALKGEQWGFLALAGLLGMVVSGVRACCAAYEDRQ